jgi:hypothetical protein
LQTREHWTSSLCADLTATAWPVLVQRNGI